MPHELTDSQVIRAAKLVRLNGTKPTEREDSVSFHNNMSRSKGGKPPLPPEEASRVHGWILKLYEECDRNATELGRRLGISRVAAKALVDATNSPSIPTIKSLAIALRMTEMELRSGQRVAKTGSERSLQVALEYSPGRWSDRVVQAAWARLRAGERHEPRGWTTVLDELAQADQH